MKTVLLFDSYFKYEFTFNEYDELLQIVATYKYDTKIQYYFHTLENFFNFLLNA